MPDQKRFSSKSDPVDFASVAQAMAVAAGMVVAAATMAVAVVTKVVVAATKVAALVKLGDKAEYSQFA